MTCGQFELATELGLKLARMKIALRLTYDRLFPVLGRKNLFLMKSWLVRLNLCAIAVLVLLCESEMR